MSGDTMSGMSGMMWTGWAIGLLVVVILIVWIAKQPRK